MKAEIAAQKEEFMKQYVLARASVIDNHPNVDMIVSRAEQAWYLIREKCPVDQKTDKEYT